MLFEVERSAGVDGREEVKAKRVVRECSVKKAAVLLEVSESSVLRYWRAGLLEGWKPGEALANKKGERKDGRAKNTKLRLCWDSVVQFRESENASQKLRREFLG